MPTRRGKSVSVGGDVVATGRGRASNGISSESYGVDLEITVGGTLTIRSKPGEGTVSIISIPKKIKKS